MPENTADKVIKSELLPEGNEFLMLSDTTKTIYQWILNSLDEYAIIVLNLEAVIKSWSKGAEKLTGFKESEMLGRHFAALFTTEDIENGAPALELETALKTGKAIDERYHVRKEQSPFLASGFLFCLMDDSGKHVGFTKIFRDFTLQKEIERQRDDSVGVVSHELKTPITGIKGYAEILTQKLQNSTDHTVLKPLERIISLSDRLTGLVNYLLEVSRSQSLEIALQLEEFAFEMLIMDVIDEVSASMGTSHKILFHPQSRTIICADRSRIAQVITNLLTNAIKYSPDQEIVRVELIDFKHNKVTFKVIDKGLGIPIDQQKLLFKRFARSQNVKKLKLPGVGLGLYISSEIISMHKGTIGFDSEEHEGSVFWFTIPCVSSVTSAPDASETAVTSEQASGETSAASGPDTPETYPVKQKDEDHGNVS